MQKYNNNNDKVNRIDKFFNFVSVKQCFTLLKKPPYIHPLMKSYRRLFSCLMFYN
jgi:hypothetical protein